MEVDVVVAVIVVVIVVDILRGGASRPRRSQDKQCFLVGKSLLD